MARQMAVRADQASPGEGRRTSSRPVDLVQLSRYTLGDRALEREILDLFRTQSKIYVERLRAAVSEKEWQDAAHSLKGSAKAVGAWRVAACAEGAEALSGEVLLQDRDPKLGEIETALGEAENYIVALLADR
jgi:HPt (histidine-containing phosphotransfer) domain-containing protein